MKIFVGGVPSYISWNALGPIPNMGELIASLKLFIKRLNLSPDLSIEYLIRSLISNEITASIIL